MPPSRRISPLSQAGEEREGERRRELLKQRMGTVRKRLTSASDAGVFKVQAISSVGIIATVHQVILKTNTEDIVQVDRASASSKSGNIDSSGICKARTFTH